MPVAECSERKQRQRRSCTDWGKVAGTGMRMGTKMGVQQGAVYLVLGVRYLWAAPLSVAVASCHTPPEVA